MTKFLSLWEITRRATKNRIIIFLGIILAVFLLPKISWAATYYVDYDNGNDMYNGTSISTPWKHSPRDVGLTLHDAGNWRSEGNAKTTTLVAGDIVYFKRGVTYRGYIQMNASGSLLKSGTKGNITACAKSGNCTLTDSDGGFNARSLVNNITSPYGPDLVYIYNEAAGTDGAWIGAIGLYEVVSTDLDTQLTIKNISSAAPKYAYSGGDMTYRIFRPITFTSRSDWGTGEATLTAILPADDSCTRPCLAADAPNSPNNIMGVEVNYIRVTNLTFKDTKYPVNYNLNNNPVCTGAGDFGVFAGRGGNKRGLFLYNNKFQDTWRNTYTTEVGDVVFINNTVTNTQSMVFEAVSLAEGNVINRAAFCFSPLFYAVIRSNQCVNASLPNCLTHQDGIRAAGGAAYIWVIGNLWNNTVDGLYFTTPIGTNNIRIVNSVYINTQPQYEPWGFYISTSPGAKIYNNTFFSTGVYGFLHTIAIGGGRRGFSKC